MDRPVDILTWASEIVATGLSICMFVVVVVMIVISLLDKKDERR